MVEFISKFIVLFLSSFIKKEKDVVDVLFFLMFIGVHRREREREKERRITS